MTVHEAKGLPDTDRGVGFNLVPGDLTDPFVSAYLGEARILKTRSGYCLRIIFAICIKPP